MTITPYQAHHQRDCLEIFDSNTPRYFAEDERPLFKDWLVAREESRLAHPVSSKEVFYVIYNEETVAGCGGYLLVKGKKEIYLAWGMVHQEFHKHGFGRALLEYRLKEIEQEYPGYIISVATSQHIAPFFQKFNFRIKDIKKQYYGEDLDRYEMQKDWLVPG